MFAKKKKVFVVKKTTHFRKNISKMLNQRKPHEFMVTLTVIIQYLNGSLKDIE